MKKALLFLFVFAFLSCKKDQPIELTSTPVDMFGSWKTESIQNPGWIYVFCGDGSLCQRMIGDTSFDCSFNYSQSGDSVFITGDFDRLWRIQSSTDTSVFILSFSKIGYIDNFMNLIRI